MTLLQQPLFYIGQRYITVLGLIAFVGFFAAGLIIARFLQSQIVRRFLSRFKIETNFIAIVTTILSLAAIVFFTVTAVNAAGIPLAWNAPLPAINLSLVQIFLLVALLVAVFWLSSGTKRFLFNRLLAQSGLDRSLQYAIAQVASNIVLVVGIFFVLENAGIHLAALAVFAGAATDHHWRSRRSSRRPGHSSANPRAEYGDCDQRQHRHHCAELEIYRFAGNQLALWRSQSAVSSSGRCGLWQRCKQSSRGADRRSARALCH